MSIPSLLNPIFTRGPCKNVDPPDGFERGLAGSRFSEDASRWNAGQQARNFRHSSGPEKLESHPRTLVYWDSIEKERHRGCRAEAE